MGRVSLGDGPTGDAISGVNRLTGKVFSPTRRFVALVGDWLPWSALMAGVPATLRRLFRSYSVNYVGATSEPDLVDKASMHGLVVRDSSNMDDHLFNFISFGEPAQKSRLSPAFTERRTARGSVFLLPLIASR